MRTALVVSDGSPSYLLPTVRALHRAGFRTAVAQPEPSAVARSRWCADVHRLPVVEAGLESWTAGLADIVQRGGYELVVPGDDAELLALSSVRDRIPGCVPYPSHDVVCASVDKLTLTRAAAAAGLGVPLTEEATDEAVERAVGRVVVKARLHWSPTTAGADRHLLVQVADGREQVRAAVAAVRLGGGEAVLQEVVDGQLTALSLVLDRDGTVLAASAQQSTLASLRRTSARAVTVQVDEDQLARTAVALHSLGWWGLANVQSLVGADGRPRVVDLNGRPYGSLALAESAGAGLLAAWARVALTPQETRQRTTARTGVRFQSLGEELMLARASGSPLRPALRAVGSATRSVHSTWDPADPLPGVRWLAAQGASALSRLRPSR